MSGSMHTKRTHDTAELFLCALGNCTVNIAHCVCDHSVSATLFWIEACRPSAPQTLLLLSSTCGWHPECCAIGDCKTIK
eukprot:scaffold580268_cov17-Prasinocladus_malaysianus.AAC.1